jgi:hypothetical protein
MLLIVLGSLLIGASAARSPGQDEAIGLWLAGAAVA